MYKLSKTSKDRMYGVNPKLEIICDLALQISPIDFGIPGDGGLRTAERQQQLFNDGKSKCDGYIKKSHHQSGNALDFYAYVDGKASWDRLHLMTVGAAFLQAACAYGYAVNYGGLWKNFKDYPHIQLEK